MLQCVFLSVASVTLARIFIPSPPYTNRSQFHSFSPHTSHTQALPTLLLRTETEAEAEAEAEEQAQAQAQA